MSSGLLEGTCIQKRHCGAGHVPWQQGMAWDPRWALCAHGARVKPQSEHRGTGHAPGQQAWQQIFKIATHLARGHPEGPLAGIVLAEDGKHALHGAQDGPVDDHRPLRLAGVLRHILHPKLSPSVRLCSDAMPVTSFLQPLASGKASQKLFWHLLCCTGEGGMRCTISQAANEVREGSLPPG